MAQATIIATTPGSLPTVPAAPTAPAAPVPAAPTPAPSSPPVPPQSPTFPQVPQVPTAPAAPAAPEVDPVAAALAKGTQPTPGSAPVPAPAATADPAKGPLNSLDPASLPTPQLRGLGTLVRALAPDLDLDRAIGNAVSYGDDRLIDAAYIKEKGGDKAEALLQAAKDIVAAAKEQGDSITTKVHELAGGEANWNTAVAVFNQKAPTGVRAVVSQLLDSFDPENINNGAQYIMDFAREQGAVTRPAGLVVPAAGGVSAPTETGLTKVEFQAALNALKPGSADYLNKRNELFRLRQTGKNRGI